MSSRISFVIHPATIQALAFSRPFCAAVVLDVLARVVSPLVRDHGRTTANVELATHRVAEIGHRRHGALFFFRIDLRVREDGHRPSLGRSSARRNDAVPRASGPLRDPASSHAVIGCFGYRLARHANGDNNVLATEGPTMTTDRRVGCDDRGAQLYGRRLWGKGRLLWVPARNEEHPDARRHRAERRDPG
jgi:hypothetical protein